MNMALFARWVPREYAQAAVEAGLVSHNASAMWIFELTQTYRPGNRIVKGSCLIVYELDAMATHNVKTTMHIDFESEDFNGEGRHPTNVIVKNNEPGAYGLGKMRQLPTNHHTTTRYATRREVARALNLNEREVDAYKPPNTTVW
jgi:hypothetical protein